MKKLSTLLFLPLLTLLGCNEKTVQYISFDEYPVYANVNLWTSYTKNYTEFKLWSPPAEAIRLNFYKYGQDGIPFRTEEMTEKDPGYWLSRIDGDHKGIYYTFQIKSKGAWLDETPGVYATAVGVNGKRAMVIDMKSTNPAGWEHDKGIQLNYPNEAILYELHVRDITTHPNAGSSYPGKYMGLVEQGTKGPGGLSTAIDHMKELGITHVHLLPSYDNYSIDETRLDSAQFNWGYDPQNYNVPEGSFSSDPYKAEVRIKEFKQMVKTFHDNGIGVILDVVYNHTGRTEGSNFNLEVPGYYYRQNEDGSWSDASACGNETASERPMVRKFITESVLFWAKEYHLDGFRFDLMGIHDIETMNSITKAVKELNPNIIIYGEGWTASGSPLPENQRALKKYTYRMPQLSAFSDDIRDGLKGSVFEDKEKGFVNGAQGFEESIKFGVVGSIYHDQIDYLKVNYSDTAWSNEPWQAVSYVSCHDNHTLFDKLNISAEGATKEEINLMHKLANAIVLTSQGMPFLHAGVEMMRTKGGEHNSYNKPDSVNQIDWNWKVQNKDVFNYYRQLITLRKAHPAFFMPSADMVRENLIFNESSPGLVAYSIRDFANNDPWKEIMVIYNAGKKDQSYVLDGQWQIAVIGDTIHLDGKKQVKGIVEVPAISMTMLFRN